MKYLTFPFLLLLLPLIGSGCSSEEKETDSLILSSDSEIFFEQGIDFAATSEPGIYRSRQDVHGGSR